MKDNLTFQELSELKLKAESEIRGILDRLQSDIEMSFTVEIDRKEITMPSPTRPNVNLHANIWDVRIIIIL